MKKYYSTLFIFLITKVLCFSQIELKKSSEDTTYFGNGKVESILIYKEGKFEKGIEYYYNGKLKTNYYIKNLIDTFIENFNEEGKLKKIIKFKDGKEILVCDHSYYENGKIESIFNYNVGKLDGECKEYYENDI